MMEKKDIKFIIKTPKRHLTRWRSGRQHGRPGHCLTLLGLALRHAAGAGWSTVERAQGPQGAIQSEEAFPSEQRRPSLPRNVPRAAARGHGPAEGGSTPAPRLVAPLGPDVTAMPNDAAAPRCTVHAVG